MMTDGFHERNVLITFTLKLFITIIQSSNKLKNARNNKVNIFYEVKRQYKSNIVHYKVISFILKIQMHNA